MKRGSYASPSWSLMDVAIPLPTEKMAIVFD
jgi:hypothetical protein